MLIKVLDISRYIADNKTSFRPQLLCPCNTNHSYWNRDRRGRDRVLGGFTTTCAISV